MCQTSESVADSLTTPKANPEFFEDFDVALEVEKMFISQRDATAETGVPASDYLTAKDDLDLNLIELIKARSAGSSKPDDESEINMRSAVETNPEEEETASPVEESVSPVENVISEKEADDLARLKEEEIKAKLAMERKAALAQQKAEEERIAAAAELARQREEEEKAAAAAAAAALEEAKASENIDMDDDFGDDW